MICVKFAGVTYLFLSKVQLLQLLQTVIGLLDAIGTLRLLGRSPGSRAHLTGLVQKTLFHQEHSMVCLVHTSLVELGKFGSQL